MKYSLALLLLIVVTVLSFGQPNRTTLSDDPAFKHAIAKNLRFPAAAVRQGKSVRAYVGFTLTKEGIYQNVSIINLGPIDKSLDEEVDRLWPMLPNVSARYAGDYVIPITFMYGENGPDQLRPIANQDDSFRAPGAYTLLKEVSVTSWIVCIKYAMPPDSGYRARLPIPKHLIPGSG